MKVVVRSVSKRYVDRRTGRMVMALDDIDLTVNDQEFVCLLGPSGCGKSTLLAAMAGLEKPDSGEIEFQGPRTTEGPLTAVVWQEYALAPWRTVLDNAAFGLELRGIPARARHEVAIHWLEKMGVSSFVHAYPHQLSGGMRQRVGIARALASDAEVLLMDEPFAAVDAQTRLLLQEQLLDIWQQSRKTVVFVTHSIDEALLLGDRIVVMSARPGRVREIVVPDLPRPRGIESEATPEFGRLKASVWDSLREEVARAAVES